MANLESELFQGHVNKYQIERKLLQCEDCGFVYEQEPLSCMECDSGGWFTPKDLTIDAADCASCGQEVLYTRDNRINTNYCVFGYLCSDCENALEVKDGGSFVEPNEFIQNGLGSGFDVVSIDSDKKETIAWFFSLQTKIEDAGFWSYQPDEFRIWLASVDNTYCGYVALNTDDELNQIWVDKGYRRRGIAAKLVRHICENVLSARDELTVTKPTTDGRKFFESISDNGDIYGKTLYESI